MAGWGYFIYWVCTLILSEVLKPKIKIENAEAASMDEANMPTASATKSIPVVWGKCRLRDPNVVWYGDYYTIPIKKKVGQGGFLGTGHAKWQTVGHRYYWGQHLALCHGPITLHKIWAEERLIWSGTRTSGGGIYINQEGMYGGEEGGGGIMTVLNYLPGNNNQTTDPYLSGQLGDVSAYRGVASLVWYGPSAPNGYVLQLPDPDYGGFMTGYETRQPSGYIGTSPSPRPITAEVSRYPRALTPSEAVIGEDANPVEIIYECLTTDTNGPDGWGMGLSTALVDTTSFKTAAHQCYTEGFGISLAWDEQTPIEDIIKEICKTIDAVCFRDFKTGMWTIKLMRGGYDVNTLPVLDESNILELETYAQASLDGTSNEIKVNYLDRSQNYKCIPAQAQDLANMRMQGEVISSTFTYRGITTAALADRVANRELLAFSTPLARAELTVNRAAYAFSPGDLFVLSWPSLGITQMVMRVAKVAIGMPNANRIRLSCVQDVFALGTSTFSVGGGTHWTDPISSPSPVTVQSAMELPYYFNQDQTRASYMVCAQRPNSGCVTFEVWEKLSSESDYAYRDTCLSFTATGVLASNYQSKHVVDAVGLTLAAGGHDLSQLRNATDSELRAGMNVAVFETGEMFAFTGVTANQDGTITLTGIWGGLFDTVPSAHTAGERIWFFGYGAVNPEDLVSQSATINVKNLPAGPRGAVTLAQATATNATMAGRNTKPLPPGKLQVNAITQPGYVYGDASVSWVHRNRLTEMASYIVRQDDAGDATAEGNYTVQVYVGGVLKRTVTALSSGPYSYTAAMRTQDSSNGGLTTEVKITQVASALSSTSNTAGQFLMSGFGMCFGQIFGGKQA